jgi:retinol dehydrogenase-12
MLAEKAAEHIRLETSSDLIEIELVDLADLDSVRNFAIRMNVKLESLDLLINNAGRNYTCFIFDSTVVFVDHIG